MNNPLEQIQAIDSLSESESMQLSTICTLLKEPSVKDHCEYKSSRPHLAQREIDGSKEDTLNQPNNTKPVDDAIGFHNLNHTTFTYIEAQYSVCPNGSHHCLLQSSRKASSKGELQSSKAYCHAVKEEKWRGECAFLLAERWVIEGGQGPRETGYSPWFEKDSYAIEKDRVTEAVQLCLESGPFISECFSHLSSDALPFTPLSNSPKENWNNIQIFNQTAKAILSDLDTDVARNYEDYFWSVVLKDAYPVDYECSGAATAWLPEEAHPHLRMGIAYQVFQNFPDSTFDEHLQIAQRCFDNKAVVEMPKILPKLSRELNWNRPWNNAETDWVFFMGLRKRFYSKDPFVDFQLAFIELYRVHNTPIPDSLKQSSDELVRRLANERRN
jgi:hypothetical protein